MIHLNYQVVTMDMAQRGKMWLLTVVYSSLSASKRRDLWEYLDQVAKTINHPWVIVRDFNEIVTIDEKNGG